MQKKIDRRLFMKKIGQYSLAGAALPVLSGNMLRPHRSFSSGRSTKPAQFSFIHFTDTHIQPELHAQEGVRKCLKKMATIEADFAIHGGDIVFDVFATGRKRADLLYKIYLDELKNWQRPVYHVIGNHDVFGVQPSSGVRLSDPEYGKALFKDYMEQPRTYASFDHKGWHFILLDSIDITSDRSYRGLIDYEQMEWLQEDLKKAGPQTPIVIVTHIPLLTLLWQIVDKDRTPIPPGISIVNAKKVWELIQPYNVKAVLQGHLHINEKMEYFDTQYITTGAVCGNWWKGPRMGHPEGFAVLDVDGDSISWRYETYGWHAVPPKEQKANHGH